MAVGTPVMEVTMVGVAGTEAGSYMGKWLFCTWSQVKVVEKEPVTSVALTL